MAPNSEEIEALIARITVAFKDTPRPNDGDLFTLPDHPEDMDYAQALKGKTWQDLPGEVARTWALMFMEPAAWAHFLPACLVQWLRHQPAPSFFPESIVLTPAGDLKEDSLERIALLNPIQREAVKDFIKLGVEAGSEEAVKAWNVYWKDA